MNTNRPIVVTCWWGFVDIDGFACAVAYAELLRLEWKNAIALLTDPLNASVTSEIRAIGAEFSTIAQVGGSYVVVDMSDPEKIQKFAPLDAVSEIYDHHFGFEKYWDTRLGKQAKIESIGAAATLIWEEFKIRWFSEKISRESATLLAHAIISNTINFRASLTNERDHIAFAEVVEISQLPKEWIGEYFYSQQAYIEKNPTEAIRHDTKFLSFPLFWSTAFWQSEIWDSGEFLKTVDFRSVLESSNTDAWIFNCIDIKNGQTITSSSHPSLLEKISETFWWSVDSDSIYFDKIVLRKEILPILQNI